MRCEIYNIGTVLYLEALFTDPFTGAPVDPDTVTFSIQPKGGTIETHISGDPAVTNPTPGTWVCAFDPLAHSTRYQWRVVSTGGYGVAEQGYFDVAANNIPSLI